MTRLTQVKVAAAFVATFFLAVACNSTADKAAETKTENSQPAPAADPVNYKAEIQAQETAWSKADNARDANAILAFYADDAVSMGADQPAFVGKAAILKEVESSLAKKANGSTLTYDVVDAWGAGNFATEVGKTTRMDAAGKVTATGKYMAVWEKRDGKWLCIRDIGNEDAKTP